VRDDEDDQEHPEGHRDQLEQSAADVAYHGPMLACNEDRGANAPPGLRGSCRRYLLSQTRWSQVSSSG
jgi:hypothetical protein